MNEQLLETVRAAGKIILEAHDIDRSVTEKEGPANFVTEYDSAVQKFLFEKLAELYPDAAFVGEEDCADNFELIKTGLAFIIDPIDGTQNFIKRLRQSAISVALCEDGTPILGVVYNPYTDELFCAEKGKGAWRIAGGVRREMHVSGNSLEQGIVLFGTSPYYTELYDQTFSVTRTLFENALDIRRFGSAALDLCMVADGRAELFYEARLSPWDLAAGVLLVKEAGGIVTQLNGEEIQLHRKSSILAGAPAAYDRAKTLLG